MRMDDLLKKIEEEDWKELSEGILSRIEEDDLEQIFYAAVNLQKEKEEIKKMNFWEMRWNLI